VGRTFLSDNPLFLLRADFGVFAAEAFDAACGVHQLLLAGKEGMAIRADFYVDVAPVCGTGNECAATGAVYAHFMVCGMNSCLHEISRLIAELFDSKGMLRDSANSGDVRPYRTIHVDRFWGSFGFFST
jgi:hypothetical protein